MIKSYGLVLGPQVTGPPSAVAKQSASVLDAKLAPQ